MASTSSPECDIIIPIWNQPALTARCLEATLATVGQGVRLILIDNGSESATREVLAGHRARAPQRITVLRNEQNLGFIKAVNQGIRASSAASVCLLNNDTVPTAGWLAEMLAITTGDPTIGLVNPSSNTLGYCPPNDSPEAIVQYARSLEAQRGQTREMSQGIGFCLLITRAVLNRIGLFDEAYGMGDFEDADFSKRALASGFRCVQAVAAYVYHEEKASFKHQRDWKRAFAENQRTFYARWGRPLRILWEDHRPQHGPEPAGMLPELLRHGHTLVHSTANGALGAEVRRFTAVASLTAPGAWRPACAWYVLARRKKPVDLVVTHDPALARWLTRLAPLHRATILLTPTPHDLETTCRRLSRSP